jgi:hypothetical protein
MNQSRDRTKIDKLVILPNSTPFFMLSLITGHWLVYKWDSLSLSLMSHYILMMETEVVPEMLILFNQLTQLAAQDFMNFSCYDSFRPSYQLNMFHNFIEVYCFWLFFNGSYTQQLFIPAFLFSIRNTSRECLTCFRNIHTVIKTQAIKLTSYSIV